MGIYRTYFDKNNTIIKDSDVNTGKNPISELSFGSRITRLVMNINLDELKRRYENKEITLTAKHYLKLKNTVEFSVQSQLNEFNNILLDTDFRPTSVDLELHKLDSNLVWDEGMGYDFEKNHFRRPEDNDFLTCPSDWVNATSSTQWAAPGAVVTGSTAIATQHLDKGNEDIVMDITDYVNTIITGVTTDANLVLKYADSFEHNQTGNLYTIGLFTRHTQTFYEPYIETVYDDVIKDDRSKFYLNKVNRLYLYVNVGGKLANLDELPIVSIPADLSATGVTHQSTGVYFVELTPTEANFTSYKKYYDTWSNLKVNGKAIPDVKMSFIPLDAEEYYQIGTDIVEPKRYGLSVSGIKGEEKITSGEKRRITVHARKPYTVNQTDVIEGIYYRVYTKVGPNQLTIIDWSEVSRAAAINYFTIDTTWMIPNKYFVDIMIKQNGETLLYNDQLVFNIVSRKTA